jgi:hypothetical protein
MDLKPQGYCKLLHRDPPEVAKRLESLLEASDAH